MFCSNKRFKFKALGINVYGGGFTLGVIKHFDVLQQWEEIKLGYKTFEANFQGIYRPICHYSDWPVNSHAELVPFIYANPPCAPWSDANVFKGQSIEKRFHDSRLHLTEHTMEAAMAMRPLVFISESVENAYNYGAKFYEPYRDRWLKLEYSVTWFLTDAVIHGAPCARRRFHFIAHRAQLQLPKPPVMTWEKLNTVEKAIGDLRNVPFNEELEHTEAQAGIWITPPYRKYLSLVEPGCRYYGHLPKNFTGKMPSIFQYRFRWDRPANTIVRFAHKVHPDAKRFITRREGMRLLTYPDNFKINGPDIGAYDTVLPLMGKFLADVAKKTILAARTQKSEFNIIDWRPLGKPFRSQRISRDKNERIKN